MQSRWPFVDASTLDGSKTYMVHTGAHQPAHSASMVALWPFTQEVVGASIRTSRDTAACGVG